MYISEVMSAPESGAEWVELFNDGDEVVDLTVWTLEDQLSSPSTIYQFTAETINPSEYLVIELPSAKLNNSADGVVLKDDTGKVIDQMSYEGSETGLCWSRQSSGIFQLAEPTKGAANQIITSSPTPSPSTSTQSPQPSSTTTIADPNTSTPPPIPTKPNYSVRNLQLTSKLDTTTLAQQTQPPLLISTSPNIPFPAIMSVILGGSLLLLLAWYLFKHEALLPTPPAFKRFQDLLKRLFTTDSVG